MRLAEVIDIYSSLRKTGLLYDHDLQGFRADCQAFVKDAQSSAGRPRVRAAGGRVLEYELRRKEGQKKIGRAHV